MFHKLLCCRTLLQTGKILDAGVRGLGFVVLRTAHAANLEVIITRVTEYLNSVSRKKTAGLRSDKNHYSARRVDRDYSKTTVAAGVSRAVLFET